MDRFMTFSEVAELARVTENTLRWLRHGGNGPRGAKIGRRLVFKESEVRAWIEAQFEEAS